MTGPLLTGLAWLFTALLLVLAVTGVAAGRGVIPRNHLIGVRLPALMRNDRAWRGGHRAAVLPAAGAFAIALVASAVGVAVPLVSWVAILAFAGGVVTVFVRSSHAAGAAR